MIPLEFINVCNLIYVTRFLYQSNVKLLYDILNYDVSSCDFVSEISNISIKYQ